MINIITSTHSFSLNDGTNSHPFQKNTINIDYDILKKSLLFYINNNSKIDVLGPYNLTSVSIDNTVLTGTNVYNQLDKLYK